MESRRGFGCVNARFRALLPLLHLPEVFDRVDYDSRAYRDQQDVGAHPDVSV